MSGYLAAEEAVTVLAVALERSRERAERRCRRLWSCQDRKAHFARKARKRQRETVYQWRAFLGALSDREAALVDPTRNVCCKCRTPHDGPGGVCEFCLY